MPDRPRILWIPHAPWSHCIGQRPRILVESLSDRFEIHVVTWLSRPPGEGGRQRFYLDPRSHLEALHLREGNPGEPRVHQVGVPLPLVQGMLKHYPPDWVLAAAGQRFQRHIRRLHARFGFDGMVAASSHHFTGYPPVIEGVPLLFDYLDPSPPHVEGTYLRCARRVTVVSRHLQDLLRERHRRDSAWIPNGLWLERTRAGDRERGRRRWGLEGRRVVSLIGLTCSARLYFVDALAVLAREVPDLVFVGAGSGGHQDAIRRRCRALGVEAVMTGWVDPTDVADLFAASDVGLYPGDDTPYFDGACPLKVLEYSGARVPVVVNQCAELRRLGFESLVMRPATVEDFVDGLREALLHPPTRFPDLSSFDWPRLATAFGDEVHATLCGAEREGRHRDSDAFDR